MTDIYRSAATGDETMQPVLTELTVEERDLHLKVLDLQLKIAEAETAQRELNALRHNCKHRAFKDVAGFPYNVRHCAVR